MPHQERPEGVQKAMAKDSILRRRGTLTPDPEAYLNPGGTLRVNPNIQNRPDDGTVAPTIGGLKTYKVNPETLGLELIQQEKELEVDQLVLKIKLKDM